MFKAGSSGGKAAPGKLDPAREVQPISSQEQSRNASSGGSRPTQKRPIQKIKPVPLQTSSTVQTRSPGTRGESKKQKVNIT
ncbi:hypothetical protein TNIN_199791 [Trichonephila inaurata madagascariensis]|uniref:Uncharacterized protein n=1 Tax=Trichonephila inaurata madagascariensis TaxID=2747483 RepID=A0A8X7CN90_9ARAC|nr:hypothetical protein TNIN_199791 [Trichonephila inaurata madagascariensis]